MAGCQCIKAPGDAGNSHPGISISEQAPDRWLRLRLTSLPEAVCELKLGLLDVADNDLITLPPRLGRMTTLRALPYSGNPLRW